MNLDIENIATTNQQIWRSIYEVIHDITFKVVRFFPSEFLNQCRKIQINLRTYQMRFPAVFIAVNSPARYKLTGG